MANHAHVKTRKKLTKEYITDLLERMNKTHFKGLMKITQHQEDGLPTWLIEYSADKHRYVDRLCWLESSRHFEMRHGGGPTLSWWIDGAITAQVAHEKAGKIWDDGDIVADPADFTSFRTYLDKIYYKRFPGEKDYSEEKRKMHMVMTNEETTPAFQDPELSKFYVKIVKTPTGGYSYTLVEKATKIASFSYTIG